MYQQSSNKATQMLEKRKKFESQPLFIKAGLYNKDKYNSVRQQGFYQRFVASELLKLRGNKEFSSQNYEKAARIYEEALSIFRFISSINPRWKNEGISDENLIYTDYEGDIPEEIETSRNLKTSIYLNLAICYLRLQDFKNSKAACDEVLKLDPNNTKALYRRAKALTSNANATSAEYRSAVENLKIALTIEPENSDVQKELARLNVRLETLVAEEKRAEELAKKVAAEKEKLELDARINSQNSQGSDDCHSDGSTKPNSPRSRKNTGGSFKQYTSQEAAKTDPEVEISTRENKQASDFKLEDLTLEDLQKRLGRALTLKKRLEEFSSIHDPRSLKDYQKEIATTIGIDLKNPNFREEYQSAENRVLGAIRILNDRISVLQQLNAKEEKPMLTKKKISEKLKSESKTEVSSTSKLQKKESVSYLDPKVLSQINPNMSLLQVFSQAIKEAKRYQRSQSDLFDNRDLNLILIMFVILLFGGITYLLL